MDAFSVPGDVLDALQAAGHRPVAAAGAAAWVAEPLTGTGALVELHVVPVVLDDAVRRRAEALVAVRHEHLPLVEAVVPLSPGRVGLVVEHVAGLSLAALRASRAPLSDGEAVTVAVPVAGALAALRAEGLHHGCVRGDAIVLRPDGRPVLTDLRGVLLGAGSHDEDLRRLLASVLDTMPNADVDLLAAAGTDSGPTLRAVLEELLVAPDVTPEVVVDRCFAAHAPDPVRMPDAGALASSDVSRAAGRAVRGTDGHGSHRARGPAPRRRVAVGVAAAAALALVVAGVVGVAHVPGLRAARASAAEPVPGRSASAPARSDSSPVPTVDHLLSATPVAADDDPDDDPARAAERLTRARAEALAAVDAAALTRVDAEASPALESDRELVSSLDAARLEGLAVSVRAGLAERVTATSASVPVTSTMSPYVRVEHDGTRSSVAATPRRTVVLELRRAGDGWRVWSVTAP